MSVVKATPPLEGSTSFRVNESLSIADFTITEVIGIAITTVALQH